MYAGLRAFTTVVSRDVSVQGVLNDVAEGRAAIYVDLLGYDEVSHHSGPERADALAVLRDIDRQLGRIARSFQWAPRPYQLVVLSDHGQTQGPPFQRRWPARRSPSSSAGCAARRCRATPTPSGAGPSRAPGCATPGPTDAPEPPTEAEGVPTVLGSGSLGLITFPGPPRRLRRDEIDARYPALIDGLAGHPHIGFVLVAAAGGSLVLGPSGQRNLATGEVVGDDPLAPFGGAGRRAGARWSTPTRRRPT